MENAILITGAARRIGRYLAEYLADKGYPVVLHYGTSQEDAEEAQHKIRSAGGSCHLVQADLSDPHAVNLIFENLQRHSIKLNAVIHNASRFEAMAFESMQLEDWQMHLQVNLTSPVFLNQAFASHLGAKAQGRIIHLLDWRALRPGEDHFAYTISKAALASVTKSLAVALAPRVQVNAIALGAILPPSDGGETQKLLEFIPAQRWAMLEEVAETVLFLLQGPAYVTGEIIHLDGGRHLI